MIMIWKVASASVPHFQTHARWYCAVSTARVNPRFMQFIASVHCLVLKALRSVIEERDLLQIRELVVIENVTLEFRPG